MLTFRTSTVSIHYTRIWPINASTIGPKSGRDRQVKVRNWGLAQRGWQISGIRIFVRILDATLSRSCVSQDHRVEGRCMSMMKYRSCAPWDAVSFRLVLQHKNPSSKLTSNPSRRLHNCLQFSIDLVLFTTCPSWTLGNSILWITSCGYDTRMTNPKTNKPKPKGANTTPMYCNHHHNVQINSPPTNCWLLLRMVKSLVPSKCMHAAN